MEQLQERVFEATKNLVGKISITRVMLYTVLSSAVIIALLFALSFPVDPFSIGFAVLISFAYSFIRDSFISRYTKRTMQSFYNYLLEKKPDVELFIPIFEKSRQGIFLRKTGLYFHNNELYLEAFNQNKVKAVPEDSISIKEGKDFALDFFVIDNNPDIVNYQGKLMGNDYQFSIVNIKEVLDLIKGREGVI
ncbi:hypothetical protein RJI07_00950 [Mycoplasmatota bacterium WC30]